MRATCLVLAIFLDSITLVIFCKEYNITVIIIINIVTGAELTEHCGVGGQRTSFKPSSFQDNWAIHGIQGFPVTYNCFGGDFF
jgi:hypothetical protein